MTEDLLILGELIAEQAAHMDAAEHRLLTNIREFDHREGWSSASSCAHWLSWRVGWSLGTAREHVRVAKALGSLPHIDEALRVGKVSYCKVRAMTRVATPANEQVLLMDAQLTTGSQLERVCRKYRQLQRNEKGANPADDDRDRLLRRRDLDNGMVCIEAVCHPEEAALIWAAIEQATKELLAARQAEERAAADSEPSSTDVSEQTCADSADGAGNDRVDESAETCSGDAGPAACDPAADVSAETRASDASSGACDPDADVYAETRSGQPSDLAHDPAADISAETCAGAASDFACESAAAVFEHSGGGACDQVAEVSAETWDDELDGAEEPDADDVYEDDCAFFEKFGVCPEPRVEPTPRAREDHRDAAMPSARVRESAERTSQPRSRSTANRHGTAQRAPQTKATSSARGRQAVTWKAQVDLTSSARAKKRATSTFNRLDGLLALMRKVSTGESLKTPVEVVVTVSAEALAKRAAPDECLAFLNDDGCINAEAARRMSCDAGIVFMVEDEHGNPLSVERRTRSIPTSIGRALIKRDRCCRFPGCTNTVYLDGHHLKHWALGGETALYNLVRLCSRHHKFVHEYGYRVEMDATGRPVFFDPQGRPAMDIPPRILRDDLGWDHILAANSNLGIEPHECGWDGTRVEYDEVCHALYLVDEGLLKPDDIC